MIMCNRLVIMIFMLPSICFFNKQTLFDEYVELSIKQDNIYDSKNDRSHVLLRGGLGSFDTYNSYAERNKRYLKYLEGGGLDHRQDTKEDVVVDDVKQCRDAVKPRFR